MLKTLKDNNRGVVFVTVLMIIIVMMVLAINIISMNVSQVKLTEGEVVRLQKKMIAEGALWRFMANQQSSTPGDLITYSVNLDNAVYDVTINAYGDGTGLFGTANVDITVE